MKKTFLTLGLAALSLAGVTVANAQIVVGDIAIVMANSDGNDSFAWVTFKDIAPGTQIKFTDSSYGNNTTTMHRWTEHLDGSGGGPLVWSHTSTVTAGTVISFSGGANGSFSLGSTSGSGPNLSASGDQIFIYTGSIVDAGGTDPYRGDSSGATYIGAVNWANSGWITSGPGSTNNSFLPAALSSAGQNLSIGNLDNYRYNGTLTGTPSELLAALNNPANWVGNDTTEYSWTAGNFVVIPEPATWALVLIGATAVLLRRKRAAIKA